MCVFFTKIGKKIRYYISRTKFFFNKTSREKHLTAILKKYHFNGVQAECEARRTIHPHYEWLTHPHGKTILYKVISAKYFEDMFTRKYLYFNRVDTYKDDINDSGLPDKDKELAKSSKFQGNEQLAIDDFYHHFRRNTYACCFSTVNSDYIWQTYSNNDPNIICLVFDYDKLDKYISKNFLHQFLETYPRYKGYFINSGLARYGDFHNDSLINIHLLNQIEYTYFKDKRYGQDKEVRITISTLGLESKTHDSIKFELIFDFNEAKSLGVIKKILISHECKDNFHKKLSDFLNGLTSKIV